MEKYCPNCRRVLGEVDFKLCPYCGTQLKERVGRQPIPGHLRHKVFQRDGYKCVECGATNRETTLEIDHIIPVSKGGTNDMSNLQTLCKACNRAKSATIWDAENIKLTPMESKRREISQLENEISTLNFSLKSTYSEEEKININYKIQIKRERIETLKKEMELIKINEELSREWQRKRNKQELLYKKYYAMDSAKLDNLLFYLDIHNGTKDYRVKYLVNHFTEEQINKTLNEIKIFKKGNEDYYLEKYYEFYKGHHNKTNKTRNYNIWYWQNLSEYECQKRINNIYDYTFFKDIAISKEVTFHNTNSRRYMQLKVKFWTPKFLGFLEDMDMFFDACCKKLGYETGKRVYGQTNKEDLDCPSCGRRISGEFVYRTNKCPFCGHDFKGKNKKNESSKSEYKSSKERNRKIPCSHCGKKINIKFVIEGKKCPYCGHKFIGKYIKCPKCNFKNDSTDKFCIKCGTKLPDSKFEPKFSRNDIYSISRARLTDYKIEQDNSKKITCPKCNHQNDSANTFCVNCGAKLEKSIKINIE